MPEAKPSKAFFASVRAALDAADIAEKRERVAALPLEVKAPDIASSTYVEQGALSPGRPARPLLVHPGKVPRRRLASDQGRVALVHAVAHIEFNAINLALDAVWRFRGLPAAYYSDWLQVAHDESRHFGWLQARLAELGCQYGDLPAHDGLWEAAIKTARDPMVRMALVPRVLEARGLDVTPGMIERLKSVGDVDTVAILEKILAEEVAHVEAGSRWYRYLCAQRNLNAESLFPRLLEEYMQSLPRGPFNLSARQAAGFSEGEMKWLGTLEPA